MFLNSADYGKFKSWSITKTGCSLDTESSEIPSSSVIGAGSDWLTHIRRRPDVAKSKLVSSSSLARGRCTPREHHQPVATNLCPTQTKMFLSKTPCNSLTAAAQAHLAEPVIDINKTAGFVKAREMNESQPAKCETPQQGYCNIDAPVCPALDV